MKYRKSEAKEYWKENLKGLWAATTTPFLPAPEYKINEAGFKHNLRHIIDNLHCEGIFLVGHAGEVFSLTIAERKRLFEIAVEEGKGNVHMMPFTGDPCLTNTLEMTKYAEEIGADLVIINPPELYFGARTDDNVYQYFKYIADRVDIAIAIFNVSPYGATINPQTLSRIAEIDNVVAVKDIVSQAEILQARILCGDKILVSDVNEENFLINLTRFDQRALFSAAQLICLQSKEIQLVREYYELAVSGEMAKATEVNLRMQPIRKAFGGFEHGQLIPGKINAQLKYWSELLGMVGGPVRPPIHDLTDEEKRMVKEACESAFKAVTE